MTPPLDADLQAKIEAAGRKAIEFRRQGFHCSESVFLAINDTLHLTDPAMVRLVTGFHGGGGTHRLRLDVNLTASLEAVAAGESPVAPGEAPFVQVGHLCGALASGIVCMGFVHGRTTPADDLTCVDELCFELHRRFEEEFGARECRALRDRYVHSGQYPTCEFIYARGAQLAVELLLTAPQWLPECRKNHP
ncbi:MAG: hypothetical protein D6796_01055 [Caldilineae bacterium]|nr:MAG: hypothetical protein D6796_01055 [Caldilineae bacterium]